MQNWAYIQIKLYTLNLAHARMVSNADTHAIL